MNGLGLNASDEQSIWADEMWLSDFVDEDSIEYVQFEFDGVYELCEMWVWNFQQRY